MILHAINLNMNGVNLMRSCGVLMHLTSLPSPYGIGTFGKEAERFADWLKDSGQKYWQLLPTGPTGYGDSPYQSFSTFAGNPLFIDLDELVANGLITKEQCEEADYGADPSFVDYEKVYRTKMELLRDAHKSFQEDVGYLSFIKQEANWLDDYALFMAVKGKFEQHSWTQWDNDIKMREPAAIARYKEELSDEMKFWKYIQYVFYAQWAKFKRYCNKNGIQLIGDIPIYVAPDSSDVWASPSLFQLDSTKNPTKVAGVPPDYFSATGQLWGNPLYDWDAMKADDYKWWIKRIGKACELYDMLRIDHFRAFDTYYAIPFGEKTAVNGKWEKGPGMSLFNAVKSELGDVNIIAEDLGEIFDSVRELLKDSGFPGMRVLQFGFNPNNEDNDHLPHRYPENCVAYTGTHDNATFRQWFEEADKESRAMSKRYLEIGLFRKPNRAAIKAVYASPARLAIIPMQDLIGLGSEGRMNIPSTLGGNWIWRMKPDVKLGRVTSMLKSLAYTYMR